jgi:ketosteroid isomerase-like protein
MSDNVQIIRDAYDGFGRGDLPTVLGLMDPDIEWSEAEGNPYQPSGKAWRGQDAIVQNLFAKIVEDFDGIFIIHPKEFYDAGDAVVVEGRYTGTFKATGKALDTQVCHISKVREGKVMTMAKTPLRSASMSTFSST